MDTLAITKNDELVIKLLHYFITERGYNPIILHGAKNEIWLENLNDSYKIVRIVSNNIYNDEQLKVDLFRANQVIKSVKKKTYTFHAETLSLYVDLGDNVHLDNFKDKNIKIAEVNEAKDLKKYKFITDVFPNIPNKLQFKEEGLELFMKLSNEINKKNEGEAIMNEQVFKQKKPIITYILMGICFVTFMLMYLLGNGSTDTMTLLNFGANYKPFVLAGQYYRLLTCAFLHIGILHLVFNMYALYIIGSQIESFIGKWKYLCVYLFSAVTGSLMSLIFSVSISAGASAAIFGLLGSLLYFGYHYRVYLGTVIKSQIIPLIAINLILGFIMTGVDNAAHIGGLIGGVLATMAVGVKHKTPKLEKINGLILSIIYVAFLIYMGFIYTV